MGYSGGLDSTVLLAKAWSLARQTGQPLSALHVNHGLSSYAGDWEQHCQRFCAERDIPLIVERVHVERSGAGLEAAAREARHAAFARHLGPADVLLLAHHAGDQSETLLLRTLRGTGIDGLAGMASRAVVSGMTLVRPWLEVSRQTLEAEAAQLGLSWVEDDSNQSAQFDRNHLRLNVLPVLRARWPATDQALARLARHAASTSGLLEDLAALDFAGRCQEGALALDPPLSEPRLANLLRYWCRRSGFALPGESALEAVFRDMLPASDDAAPLVTWAGAELRQYRRRLFLMAPLDPIQPGETSVAGPAAGPAAGKALPVNGGLFRWEEGAGNAVLDPGRLSRLEGTLVLRWRQGGESFKPAGRATRPLRKWWQDAGLPPWWRERTPLLYAGDRLIAVPGLGVAEGCQAADGVRGWRPAWSPGGVLSDGTTSLPLR